MIAGEVIVPIRSLPGIKRDGTEFEGNMYVDGQWVRFRRGLPRKIGGFRSVTASLQGPVYSVFIHSSDGVNRVYTGSSSALEYTDITSDGIGGGVGNRTPAAFPADTNNLWQFAEMYDSGGTSSVILAHAAPNLTTLDSSVQTPVWVGDIEASAVLVNSTCPSVSGGVFTAPPYGFALDNDGLILWCVPNTPDDWAGVGSGNARITQSKLVCGAQVRGADTVTFLVWSLDTLIRGQFVGGTPIFDFNTVGTISLMSSRSVVEYNGVYYWMGQDRFQSYNGVIQDIQNGYNLDWFLDNMNYNQRQKVWGQAVPKYGEIWWHFPSVSSDDCDHALIFKVNEGIWYDTQVSRTCGVTSSVFRWPLMVDELHSHTTWVRVLNGTPSSSAGVAANAFDGDVTTVCAAGVNGYIIYDFGASVLKHIHKIGLIPGAGMTSPCAVLFEYSLDTGASPTNWTTFYSIPSQTWTVGTLYTFQLRNDHPAHELDIRAMRVSVSGGDTLTAAEVYLYGHGHLLLQHEFGNDSILEGQVTAIDSYFETADISWAASGPVAGDQWSGQDIQMEAVTLEPDFEQVGSMEVSVTGRSYPKADLEVLATRPFDPDTKKVDFKTQKRIMRFQFRSNTQGGFYQMGQPLMKVGKGDVHR